MYKAQLGQRFGSQTLHFFSSQSLYVNGFSDYFFYIYSIFVIHKKAIMLYKKKVLSVIFLLAIGLTSLKAQEAITATGGNASGSGGSASYSVGQVVYTNNTGAGGSVSQGVQQPYEISVVSGIDDQGITLSYTIYPNPTTVNVVLEIGTSSSVATQNIASLQYILSDINGKKLNQQTITGNQTTISMEQLPAGTYFVTILERLHATSPSSDMIDTKTPAISLQRSNQLKTFKIIKY